MGMTIFLPLSIAFLVPFLLTLHWYIRSRSVAGLFLGAVVQPIVTAAIFTTEIVLFMKFFNLVDVANLNGFFTVIVVYTLVISVPLALFCCIVGPMHCIQVRASDQGNDDQNVSFVTLIAAGGISFACASLAAGLFLMRAA